MANATQILARKAAAAPGDSLATLAPNHFAIDAATLMNERHVGSVLILDPERQVLGIFTERDVLRRIVADHRDPDTTRLADVMTSPVACASPDTTCDELRAVMREKRIRHVPVVDDADEHVLGMISLGDLNQAEMNTQVQTIRYLQQYISVG